MESFNHQESSRAPADESVWSKISREVNLFKSATTTGVSESIDDIEKHPWQAAAKFGAAAAIGVVLPALTRDTGLLGVAGKIAVGSFTASAIKDVALRTQISWQAADAVWNNPLAFDSSKKELADTIGPFITDTAIMMAGGVTGAAIGRIPKVATAVDSGIDTIKGHTPTLATLRENRLLDQLEQYHPESAEHTVRVGKYSRLLAGEMDLKATSTAVAEHSGKMHDIGKLDTPMDVLDKPGDLSPQEAAVMHSHAAHTRERLDAINYPERLSRVPEVASNHHQHFDGSGYGPTPQTLSGEQIPLETRVVTVADVFDALVAKRTYKPGLSVDTAVSFIDDNSGKLFDPKVVEAFHQMPANSVLKILETEPGRNPIVDSQQVHEHFRNN